MQTAPDRTPIRVASCQPTVIDLTRVASRQPTVIDLTRDVSPQLTVIDLCSEDEDEDNRKPPGASVTFAVSCSCGF